MIKRAQISFICITMSILFAVFAIICVGIYYLMYKFTERNVNKILDDSHATYQMLETEGIIPSCAISKVTFSVQNDEYYYEYWFDDNVFTNNTVKELIETAFSRPYLNGNIGKTYYKIYDLNTIPSSYLLVATDATLLFNMFESNVASGLLIVLGIYLILFYLVYRISFSVFSPLREMFNKQKQFISDASHELKTPLAIISANTDVLSSQTDNAWLSNIKAQTKRMNTLVSDMLTLTKLDEGRKKYSAIEFSLSDETLNTALQFDALAFEKGKTIKTDVVPNVKINADIHAFKQILTILLDNAIKYALDNSEILVTLKKENGKTMLSVMNFGSDVPDGESEKIFERFYRGDQSRSRQSGGSGLGLSIAKSISDANKWKISAHSHLNHSMTVTIVF